tara:strand:+ start:5236 stop:5943 length:708 start_codon:yes stop_codon:yes gene_type:complete
MLPKIKEALFDVTIPSTKKVVKVRQFTVKEEKILLMCRQSGEVSDYFSGIAQIVNNCIQDKTNVMKLPLFDVEYLFTKIRAVSVSNISKVSYRDAEDQKQYDFDIDLDKLEVIFPPDIVNKFKISKDMSFTMKYPAIEIYTNKDFFTLDEEKAFDKLASKCMDKVFEGETVHDCSEETPESILEFVNSMPAKTYNEMRKFLYNLPSMKNELKYTNSNGKEVVLTQKSIEDFFTFG